MRKAILTLCAAVAAVIGIGLAAGPAMAGTTPGAVFAVTHSAAHNDTTSGGAGTACTSSVNGPVWAIDNLTEKFTATPTGNPGEWAVTINVGGSFAGFADPNTCNALASNGPVSGVITYIVQSPNVPSGALLYANQAPDTGLGAAMGQLFGGNYTITGGGDYTFSYQNGGYVQTTSGITGAIRGH
jgi:hypothetical protein